MDPSTCLMIVRHIWPISVSATRSTAGHGVRHALDSVRQDNPAHQPAGSGSSPPTRMARPRAPGDPVRWPVPCGRCGEHHQIAANWPDAAICVYCYQQAKRTRGTCACGHQGVLPGLIAGAPACRDCSGVRLNVDCRSCGAEDELYDAGRCWSCVLAATSTSSLPARRPDGSRRSWSPWPRH